MKPRHDKSPPDKKSGRNAPPMTAGRKWAFRLFALLIVPLALVVCEIGLRIAGYGYSPDFFKPIRIANHDYLVQADDFSLRFFPKETARNPCELRMDAAKQKGTFRIFIFGESAAMGDPEPAYGAGRYLEVLLREKYPGIRFEVVNVAFTAINSHVILPIARECAAQDGDAWIIYMGNNEMVGPFGAATVFGAQAPPLFYVRLSTAIRATRIGQLVTATMRKLTHQTAKSTSWGGMQMFLDNRVPPDSRKKEMVYHNFDRNLHDILEAGLSHHAKILLNTVAVNLKDSPPFASWANTNLSASDRTNFDAAMARGRALSGSGDFAQAAGFYRQAAKLDEKCAESRFLLGDCLLRLTNFSAAREQLQSACDNDALPFRADSRVNGIIRSAAKENSNGNLVLFDAANVLAEQNPEGVCGYETFYEHVHFDFDGNYRLGLAWAQQVEKMLPADANRRDGGWAAPEQCPHLLGLTDWNRALVVESVIGRMQVPPFSSEPNIAARIEELRKRVNEIHSHTNAYMAAAERENFRRQLERWPEDFVLRENFALFLQASGDATNAIAEWRKVHEMIPYDYIPYFQMGRMLGGIGEYSEAEQDLQTCVKLHPSLTEGWFELGNVLAVRQKFPEALDSYAIARQQRPQDAQTVFRIGKVNARLNHHPEAVQLYREAITLNPSDWESHYELAGEMDTAGKLEEARKEFGEAARLNPGYSRAHFNYGVLLAKLGHLDEAQHEFAETLRLEPGYKGASDNLAKIQMLKLRPGRN